MHAMTSLIKDGFTELSRGEREIMGGGGVEHTQKTLHFVIKKNKGNGY